MVLQWKDICNDIFLLKWEEVWESKRKVEKPCGGGHNADKPSVTESYTA